MLSESLYVVLALVNVLILGRVIDGDALADRPDRRGALRWIAAAGIAAGLAALTRPSHVFFLAVACLWLLAKRRLSWAAELAITAALTIAPWTIRNYLTYGRPVLIASEGGITFWTGNHPLSPGEGDMAANPAIKLDSLRVRDGHPGLTAEELEPIYYREALGAIAARPGWWLGLEARKFFYLWIPVGPSYLLHSRLFLYATWLSYGVLLPLGLLALSATLVDRGPFRLVWEDALRSGWPPVPLTSDPIGLALQHQTANLLRFRMLLRPVHRLNGIVQFCCYYFVILLLGHPMYFLLHTNVRCLSIASLPFFIAPVLPARKHHCPFRIWIQPEGFVRRNTRNSDIEAP
jgi:4-amino-4-deoxy-L-arabinose transferase-like glycosyltransferase